VSKDKLIYDFRIYTYLQCHVVKNTLLQSAFSAILSTELVIVYNL